MVIILLVPMRLIVGMKESGCSSSVLVTVLLILLPISAWSAEGEISSPYVADQLLLHPLVTSYFATSASIPGQLLEYLQGEGIKVIQNLPYGVIQLQLPAESDVKAVAAGLIRRSDVRWVEPNYIRRPQQYTGGYKVQ